MGITKTIVAPSYYKRLSGYFPSHEMKDARQLRALVEDVPYYNLIQSEQYLVLMGNFSDFLFIDYLLVNRDQRGGGIGSRVMKKLQARKKPILLEVEPADPRHPDTVKRRKFYERNGFREATGVLYERLDKEGKPYVMDLLYWSPSQQISDERVVRMMTKVCNQIHNYQAKQYYDRIPAEPGSVLSLAAEV